MKDSPLLETNGQYGGLRKYYIDGTEVSKEKYHTALMEYYNNRAKTNYEGAVFEESTEVFKYTEFEDYFRKTAPLLWNVKQWDNETIKAWLEDAFNCSRITTHK